jgi:hypothetical protein
MKPYLSVLLILFFALLISCNSYQSETTSETTEETVDETEPTQEPAGVEEPVVVEDDDAAEDYTGSPLEMVEDIAEPIILPEPEPKKGKLAVYCPREMTYKQSSDVIGFIADVIDDELIRESMMGRVDDAVDDMDEVSDDDVLIRELQYYSTIELSLNDADNEGFTIKKIHDNDLQTVRENMEGWHWKVTPTSNSARQQLVLKVIVYDSNGEQLTSFGKTYHIDIKIESGMFFRNTLTLFVENPEWAFASIITPVLTFLAGLYRGRRKRKKVKKKNE